MLIRLKVLIPDTYSLLQILFSCGFYFILSETNVLSTHRGLITTWTNTPMLVLHSVIETMMIDVLINCSSAASELKSQNRQWDNKSHGRNLAKETPTPTFSCRHISNSDASDLRITEAKQECSVGPVLENQVQVLLPNEPKYQSSGFKTLQTLIMTRM